MLTAEGRREAFEFGRCLRERYMAALGISPQRFRPTEVYARSKDLQRTVVSIQCVLAGMYEPQFAQKNLHPDPVLIVCAPSAVDILTSESKRSKAASESHLEFKTSPEYVRLVSAIQRQTGDSKIHPDSFHLKEIAQQIAYSKERGQPLPAWILPIVPEIEAVSRKMVQLRAQQTHGVAVPLLREVVSCMRANVETLSSPRLFLFACSDSTILPMLEALACSDGCWPPFLADLVFELYQDAVGTLWVKVMYRGKVKGVCGLPPALIPLTAFRQALAPFLPDFERQQQAVGPCPSKPRGSYVSRYHHVSAQKV